VERTFRTASALEAVRFYRAVAPLALALWLAMGAFDDLAFAGALLVWVRVLRFAIVTPLLVAAWALGYTSLERFARWWQLAVAGVFAVIAGATVGFAGFANDVGRTYGATGVSLVIISGYTLSQLRFAYAAAVGVLASGAAVAVFGAHSDASTIRHLALDSGGVWLLVANLAGGLACYQLEHFRRSKFFQGRLLDVERERTEALLHHTLPVGVVERLRRGDQQVVDAYDDATVLFGDLVGFTALAENTAPGVLVSRLNELFIAFDEIAAHLGLEKIKTIGDAYMVVGGIPAARGDHTRAVAAMALDMRDAVVRWRRRFGWQVEIRIGIHCGPLVAGVIGAHKFSYDVWGDTVNTASRMQSHGVVGEIQVSEQAYARLRREFRFRARGEVELKGKRAALAYLLLGPRDDSASADTDEQPVAQPIPLRPRRGGRTSQHGAPTPS
jgi:class 3 adenylate cyclase